MSNTQTGCFSLFRPFQLRRPATIFGRPDLEKQCRMVETNSANLKHEHISEFSSTPFYSNLSSDPYQIRDDTAPPQYATQSTALDIYRPEVLKTIESEIKKLRSELEKLSIAIHDNPELNFKEKFAHDTLTKFMSSHGFHVTKNYILATGWKATFSHGTGGRTIGVNAEMTALPGIGHGCGRNLVSMIGVGVSLAIKAALVKHDIAGHIILLGTPASEGGGGKGKMYAGGGFAGMDACVMTHPFAGPPNTAGTGPCTAYKTIKAKYTGVGAHASAEPWEGKNALDAAVIAYSSISALRQQIKPANRVHGIIEGDNLLPSIIPDNATMTLFVRAPNQQQEELDLLSDRVKKCLQAAADATDTDVEITIGEYQSGLFQNEALARDFAEVSLKYGIKVSPTVSGNAGSTEFGKLSTLIPALHPSYTLPQVPTVPRGGNHTRAFAAQARTEAAHQVSLDIAKVLAHTGMRVIADNKFFDEVKSSFEKIKAGK